VLLVDAHVDQYGKMPVALGPEDVGLELGAIPHRDVDVLLDLHLVSGFGRFGFFAGRDLLLHGTSQPSRLRVQRYQRPRFAAMEGKGGTITPNPSSRAGFRPASCRVTQRPRVKGLR